MVTQQGTAEQSPSGGTGQGQPSASGAQGPGFCCPLFLGLSHAEPGAGLDPCGPFLLGIFRDPHGAAPRAALSLLPTLLPSCCRNCCSGLPQEQRGNSQQLLLWRGASSCHSGQRDEAGLGLPFLIQEGYPHFRPFHALSSANSQSPVGRGAAAGASKQSPG